MNTQEEWAILNPTVKLCWIVKGFFMSLVFPLIFLAPFLIALFFDIGIIGLLIYLIVILIINIFIIIWAIMFYDRYKYKIGEKTVEIKRGILWKRDVTIPYERIQHVSSTRGPIEQLFKLHIVNIFTAGTSSVVSGFGGSMGMFSAEGYIPGVKHPEELKKTIMNLVKEFKSDDGLGRKAEIVKEKRLAEKTDESEILIELRKIRKIMEENKK